MNNKTKEKYCMARMYEYVNDIVDMTKGKDIQEVLSSKTNRHAINMCLVQIGENANRLKSVNINLYNDKSIGLSSAKGMRDRIVHGYGNIDYDVVRYTVTESIPALKKYIEEHVYKEVLDNPYQLHEIEYESLEDEHNVKHERKVRNTDIEEEYEI